MPPRGFVVYWACLQSGIHGNAHPAPALAGAGGHGKSPWRALSIVFSKCWRSLDMSPEWHVPVGMLQEEPQMTVRRGAAFRTITRGCLWSAFGAKTCPLGYIGGVWEEPITIQNEAPEGAWHHRHAFSILSGAVPIFV